MKTRPLSLEERARIAAEYGVVRVPECATVLPTRTLSEGLDPLGPVMRGRGLWVPVQTDSGDMPVDAPQKMVGWSAARIRGTIRAGEKSRTRAHEARHEFRALFERHGGDIEAVARLLNLPPELARERACRFGLMERPSAVQARERAERDARIVAWMLAHQAEHRTHSGLVTACRKALGHSDDTVRKAWIKSGHEKPDTTPPDRKPGVLKAQLLLLAAKGASKADVAKALDIPIKRVSRYAEDLREKGHRVAFGPGLHADVLA